MANSPFEEHELKGSRKLNQHISDLLRNKRFQNAIKDVVIKYEKICELSSITLDEFITVDSNRFSEIHYDLLGEQSEQLLAETIKDRVDIAQKYGLPLEPDEILLINNPKRYEKKFIMKLRDIVEPFALDDWVKFKRAKINDPDLVTEAVAYPLQLMIHRYASKEDVIDYIDKEWVNLKIWLYGYTNFDKKTIRSRKYPRELTDYIWENRDRAVSDLAQDVAKKWPEFTFIENDIYKFIYEERKRRDKDLSSKYTPPTKFFL